MYPILLHHGLFGYDEIRLGHRRLMGYFRRIDRAIAQTGRPLIVSRVHPTGSIARRARQLKQKINAASRTMGLEDRPLLIVAHSLGGLDARYMISRLGMAPRVAALLTVTTPHRGSAWADWCVRHLGRRLGGFQLTNALKIDVEGVLDLTTERCAAFNEEIPDDPSVAYYSITCARPRHQITPLLYQSHKVIFDAEGPNDGLVSVASAQWGTHLCTWPADHLHSINKRLVLEFKHPTGDITPYYLKAIEAVEKELDGRPGHGT